MANPIENEFVSMEDVDIVLGEIREKLAALYHQGSCTSIPVASNLEIRGLFGLLYDDLKSAISQKNADALDLALVQIGVSAVFALASGVTAD